MGLNNVGTLSQGTPASVGQTGSTPANTSNEPRRGSPDPAQPTTLETDTYHGPGSATAPNPLIQKGIGAYVQLLNALAGDALHEQSAQRLLNDLRGASALLKSAYSEAVARLPPALAAKDWGFSLAEEGLIFTTRSDDLQAQDLLALRNAFAGSNVAAAARQVASALSVIEQLRNAGSDPRSLASTRLSADVADLGDALDLRTYVTATAPGGHYHPSISAPASQVQIPPVLGGMDLRNLLTARPRFLREDGSVRATAHDESTSPAQAPQVNTLHGGCACGHIRFHVQDEFAYAFYCHCSRCRVRTGSAFAAIAGIAIDKLEVTAGHEQLLLEGECSDGYGARCGRCFAFLFAAVRGRTYLHVSLGTLADTPTRVPDHHI